MIFFSHFLGSGFEPLDVRGVNAVLKRCMMLVWLWVRNADLLLSAIQASVCWKSQENWLLRGFPAVLSQKYGEKSHMALPL